MDEMYKVYASKDYVDNKIEESRVQPDWSQNDPDAADYVKNRTHWVEQGLVEIVPETSFETADMDGLFVAELPIMPVTEEEMLTDSIAPGDVRTVVFDGVEYETALSFDNGPHFGNLCVIPENDKFADDTGEPFLWMIDADSMTSLVTTRDTDPTTHTIACYKKEETVHTIDPKFLPDSKADWNQNDPTAVDYVKNRTHYTKSVTAQIADNVTVTIANAVPAINPFTIDKFIEGCTYTVTWDGAAYECVAYIAEGPNVPSLGNAISIGIPSGGNGEPFFITASEGESLVFGEDGTHTLSMIGEVEVGVRTLDPKYLPGGIEYAEKTAINRIHGGSAELQAEDRHVFIENVPFLDFIEKHNTCYFSVKSSGSITLPDGTQYLAVGGDDHYTTWNYVTGPSGTAWRADVDNPIIRYVDGRSYIRITEVHFNPVDASLDCYFNTAMPDSFTGSITVEVSLFVHSDEKAAQSITMWSSTKGSVKRFRITVDDSGILTATEV